MNDYALINSLLEDGSVTSILKLKMIIDFLDDYNLYSNHVLGYIKERNVILFVITFKEYYNEFFKNTRYNIFKYKIDTLEKLISMFGESFKLYFERNFINQDFLKFTLTWGDYRRFIEIINKTIPGYKFT